MNIVKLSKEKNVQSISLPQEYQIEGTEAYIKKVGNAIILIPKDNPWQTLFSSIDLFSNDFMEHREQLLQLDREELFE